MHLYKFIIYILCLTRIWCCGFGFLAPAGVAISSIVLGTICRLKECCSEYSIHADFEGMQCKFLNNFY